jgi:hypothetical protein
MPFARIAADGIFHILGGSLTGFNAPPAAAVVDALYRTSRHFVR